MSSITTDYTSKDVAKHFAKTPLLHEQIGRPALLKFIGAVKGKRVLDIGCGPGFLTSELAKRGAKCVGVDPSAPFVEAALRQYPKIPFVQRRGSQLKGFDDSCFDCAILSMVLVNVASKREFEGIFRESARVLCRGGELIICAMHPLVIRNFKDALRAVRLTGDGAYLKPGSQFKNRALMSDGTRMEFSNAHWSLTEISQALIRHCFVITELFEPSPPKNRHWSKLKDALRTPQYIFIRALLLKK